MSTRNISWWVKAAGAWGWQPYHLHVPIVLKSGSLNLLEPSGPVQACNGIALPIYIYIYKSSSYLTDNTRHSLYKDQSVNSVTEMANCSLPWGSQVTSVHCVGRMQFLCQSKRYKSHVKYVATVSPLCRHCVTTFLTNNDNFQNADPSMPCDTTHMDSNKTIKKEDPLNLLCGAGNLGNILSAHAQHKIQNTEWMTDMATYHFTYMVRQKYLTILQNSCEWNHWLGEFVLERSSSETQLPWSAGL